MAKQQFKAESQRLLDLMINSIYTHKEIFLREIISNASDAMDKLAYLALTDNQVGMSREDFAITIETQPKYRILTVSDNGIGMSREEMEENLGTICKSGSLDFKSKLESTDEVDIIGQFGVGFYSAFMAAETVTVISRKYGSSEAFMWQSSGADGYTIEPAQREAAGTDVIMKLKEDTEDETYSTFLEEYRIRELVRKYSDYIRYPIRMEVTKSRMLPQSEEDKKEGKEPQYEDYKEVETLNSMVPLWQRNKKDVTEEEYAAFYREKFFDFEKPISHLHLSVEGAVTYKALLYIPGRAPYDFYTKDYKKGLQLYSSGVLIMDSCEDLLPDHFRFVRGIVDSQDLSLNISRELLQHNRQLSFIAKNLEKRIRTELLNLMKDNRETYEKFYATFGRQLKYGIVSEYGVHKDTCKDLLLFWSHKEGKLISLQEYVDAMAEGQEKIYFAPGESKERLSKLPQVSALTAKGYDVLLFTEDVDEFIPQTLVNFADKEFCNVSTDDLGLASEEDKQKTEEKTQEMKAVLDFVQESLGERIKEVRLSNNLGDYAVALVPDAGMSFEMEKYMKRMNPEFAFPVGRILELNAEHPAVSAMTAAVETEPEKAKDYAELLYSQALLMADLPLEDPMAYAALVCKLMK
ncbi:MAG: molecular chaperone HtpG [Ruminococcaceae bacterium]|nr:molecular chaperone HtpG [Oscillospiraceae bacterium]